MSRTASIVAILADFAQHGTPETQAQLCASAARTVMRRFGAPLSDLEFIDCGYALARGLFDSKWEATSEGQRWVWIDMCETALREAAR